MKIQLKLFGPLQTYLPSTAVANTTEVELDGAACVKDAVDVYQLTPEQAHLVLLNGIYVAPTDRSKKELSDGDAVAIWPPVAGG